MPFFSVSYPDVTLQAVREMVCNVSLLSHHRRRLLTLHKDRLDTGRFAFAADLHTPHIKF